MAVKVERDADLAVSELLARHFGFISPRKLTHKVAQVLVQGLRAAVLRRLLCWSLFWHALDIVWVGAIWWEAIDEQS